MSYIRKLSKADISKWTNQQARKTAWAARSPFADRQTEKAVLKVNTSLAY
jgi:hypothetical protein